MSKQRKRREPHRAVPSAHAPEASQVNQAVGYFTTIMDMFAQHGPAQERYQRAMAAYVFGMLLAYGQRERLPPASVMGTMNLLLVTKLGNTAQAADQRTRTLIDATQPGADPALHTLIYRGIDGLARWTTAGQQAALNDFLACLATLEDGSAL